VKAKLKKFSKKQKLMLDNSTILIYNVTIEIKINSGGKKMKILRVVEYTDLDDENHTKDFENASDAVRFFMMITSERLVKRAIHKSQEEYQMIHNALSESEDLPF